MSLESLKNALETRGYAIDTIAAKPPASLERLLPLAAESDAQWLARRAATELSVDTDLRFLQFHQMIVPDMGAGQTLGAIGLETAMSELKHLLDLEPAQKSDPLAEKLNAIAGRGRRSAAVTRLEIAPDLGTVMVEITFWIRPGQRWIPYGSRSATVRPDDLDPDAGKQIAEDPQVQGAFRIVELLGLVRRAQRTQDPQPANWGRDRESPGDGPLPLQ